MKGLPDFWLWFTIVMLFMLFTWVSIWKSRDPAKKLVPSLLCVTGTTRCGRGACAMDLRLGHSGKNQGDEGTTLGRVKVLEEIAYRICSQEESEPT